MLPCFNSEATLPRALASLVAQTVDDWECVCVDDGSTDGTWEILQRIAAMDSRFRIERFPENRGRGAARQRILEEIRGELLAFLDADDWMYPGRIEHEVYWLQAEPKIALISVPAAATRDDKLIGVMRPRPAELLPVVERFTEPVPPPILFPTSMIRADLARATGFDARFRRSQDSDFLIRALRDKHFALSGQVKYAYSTSATTWRTTLVGYRYRMQAHLRHWRSHPVRVSRTLATTAAKMIVYGAAGIVNLEHKLIDRRWGALQPGDEGEFEAARAVVMATQARLWQ